jgi:tetratricopeptide (TPR) repeat protein
MSGRILAQLAIVAALAVVPLVPAYAQSSQQRAALQQFQDSLATASDTTMLLRLERELIASAKVHRDSAELHLRLGFIALRMGELGGRGHFEDAASEFQWSIDLEPDWPYSWYGMGLAEYGIGDSRVSVVAGLQQMFGKDALSRSAIAFAKSAQVDRSFAKGLVELANTALQQRVNIKLNVALDALRRAAGTSATLHPDVLLARTAPSRPSASTRRSATTGRLACSRSPAPGSCLAISRDSWHTTKVPAPTTPSRLPAIVVILR